MVGFVLSCNIYIAKITSYSPVYFLMLSLNLLSILYFFKIRKIKITVDVFVLAPLLVYLLLTQANNLTGEFINLFTALTAYVLIRIVAQKMTKKKLLEIFYLYFKFTVVILFLDTCYRLLNPGAPTPEHEMILMKNDGISFYLYKFNTLMFADSNTTGLISLIALVSYLSIKGLTPRAGLCRFWIYSMLLILLLSLSRAAIFTYFLTLVVHYYNKLNVKIKVFATPVFVFVIVALILFIYLYIEDGSLNSKFYLLNHFYSKFFSLNAKEIIFGVGFDSYEEFMGMSSHLLFLTVFLSMGLIGFALYVLFFIHYSVKYSFLLIFAVTVVSMSYFLYAGSPFLFVPMALIASLLEKENKLYEN